jgi:hypothetical protein
MTAARSTEGPSCPVESAVDIRMPNMNGILISGDQLDSHFLSTKGVGFAKQLEWGPSWAIGLPLFQWKRLNWPLSGLNGPPK